MFILALGGDTTLSSFHTYKETDGELFVRCRDVINSTTRCKSEISESFMTQVYAISSPNDIYILETARWHITKFDGCRRVQTPTSVFELLRRNRVPSSSVTSEQFSNVFFLTSATFYNAFPVNILEKLYDPFGKKGSLLRSHIG